MAKTGQSELNEEKLKKFAEKAEKGKSTANVSLVGTTSSENTSMEDSGVGTPDTPIQDIKSRVGNPIQDTSSVHKPWEKKQDRIDFANQIGWHKLPIGDLPTQGFFYPEGTEITIRAAIGNEIRHWSTINEEDLSALDDMLNYVIERCAKIKFPDNKSSWRDIKEIDRFYILLAIREITFVDGENKLQVKTSETSKIDVTKDMVNYITFDERLMKYYDSKERLFVLIFKNGKRLKITIPSVGVTNWLKNYILRKRIANEVIDEDFISFAPFVVLDWKGLNDDSYGQIILDSHNWSTAEISVLTKVRDIFGDAVDPVVRYLDEEGGEREVPLTFQGGIKSLFLISDPFSELV